MIQLADLTTLRLGGPAHAMCACTDRATLIAAVNRCDDAGEPVLILGGGSNLVVADAGFAGTVLRVQTTGIDRQVDGPRTIVTAQAGESWDRLVNQCVDAGLAGIECLAGIPGCVGATPIQNVGAYGQEVAQTIVEVVVYDRAHREIQSLSPAQCEFTYRSSVFKRQTGRWIVLQVGFELRSQAESGPIRYAELARRLGIAVGESAPLADVRAAVLSLRRAKGMVLDPTDPDTVSAGSFFLNPILTPDELTTLKARVRERCGEQIEPPVFAAEEGMLKTSAAWLIERAGFHRGFGNPDGIAISTKHTLALTNRGSGTTTELVALARDIAHAVRRDFGVELRPEPVFVGHGWTPA